MVMATGIVSIAAHMLGLSLIAVALFWLTIVAYLVLWLLNVLRAIWFARDFFSDMVNHQRGMGFFTIVAGSCVLGSQFVLIAENYQVATYLWVLALVLWIGLTYTIFTAFTVNETKPSLEAGIYIALFVWLAVFTGLVHALVNPLLVFLVKRHQAKA
ncbi:MAG: hypothetical protein A3G83_11500 [Betaproteobacteria bacterium RIFCSPLOWO2_12_FULL_68_20]|nr:MAG: hypothetical protein A3G83_11500 [Betaproteobacteria bacterium RIFCSPLOWO2_12_FULL_68_20]